MDTATLNSEELVIGSCLLDPSALRRAVEMGVTADWFEEPFCVAVWRIIARGLERDITPDIIYVGDQIGNINEVTRAQHIRLAEVAAGIISTENIDTHLTVLHGNYLKRRAIDQLRIAQAQLVSDEDPGLIIKKTMEKLGQIQTKEQDWQTSIVRRLADLLSRRIQVSTGIPKLDAFTLGFEPATFWVIGGDTSHGKSTLALNFALNVINKGHHVTFISTEMRDDLFYSRLITMIDGIRRGLMPLTGYEFDAAMARYENLAALPLEFSYTVSLPQIRLLVQRNADKGSVFIIDHLQDIHAHISADSRREEVAYVARVLEELSKQYRICVVCNSKLSRPPKAARPSDVPNIHSYKESGEIEYSADIACLLHYEYAATNVLSPREMQAMRDRGEDHTLRLGLVKNRITGDCGQIMLYFDRKRMLVREMTSEEEVKYDNL